MEESLKRNHHFIVALVAALLIVGWIVLLLFVSPTEIVTFVGVQNAYFIAFIFAASAGVSTFTSASFYALISTFALGGTSPWLLGIAGGVGLFISNALFYFLFLHGKHLVTGRLSHWIESFTVRINHYPTWAVLSVVYLYSGFTPLPDDILVAALALSSYSFVRFGPVLFLGNVTLITLIGLLTQYGFSVV